LFDRSVTIVAAETSYARNTKNKRRAFDLKTQQTFESILSGGNRGCAFSLFGLLALQPFAAVVPNKSGQKQNQ
jgi:hypothetical protein